EGPAGYRCRHHYGSHHLRTGACIRVSSGHCLSDSDHSRRSGSVERVHDYSRGSCWHRGIRVVDVCDFADLRASSGVLPGLLCLLFRSALSRSEFAFVWASPSNATASPIDDTEHLVVILSDGKQKGWETLLASYQCFHLVLANDFDPEFFGLIEFRAR